MNMLQLLLQYDPHLLLPDGKGHTPVDCAHREEIADKLRAHQANQVKKAEQGVQASCPELPLAVANLIGQFRYGRSSISSEQRNLGVKSNTSFDPDDEVKEEEPNLNTYISYPL